MLTNVEVTLISGDKFELDNITELAFENELLIVRSRVGGKGGEEFTRAIFRKDLVKSVLQTPDLR